MADKLSSPASERPQLRKPRAQSEDGCRRDCVEASANRDHPKKTTNGRSKRPKGRIIAALAFVLAVMASGFIGNRVGYHRGVEEGKTTIPESGEPSDAAENPQRYLEVCRITFSGGEDGPVDGQPTTSPFAHTPEPILFYTTEEQARQLTEADLTGELHVTFSMLGDGAGAFTLRPELVLVPQSVPEASASARAAVPSASPETSSSTAATEAPTHSEASEAMPHLKGSEGPNGTATSEATLCPATTDELNGSAAAEASPSPTASEVLNPSATFEETIYPKPARSVNSLGKAWCIEPFSVAMMTEELYK